MTREFTIEEFLSSPLVTDELLYSEVGRRRAARVKVRRKPTCECGQCGKCKARVRNQKSRERKQNGQS